MGQFWEIVNLDRRERLGVNGKLGEWLTWGQLAQLKVLLAEPKIPPLDALFYPYEPGKQTYHHTLQQTKPQCSPFLELPTELIQRIFNAIDEFAELVMFSQSCQALWEFGRHEMCARVLEAARSSSWMGDRLVCIGDGLQNEDIPAGLLLPGEEEALTTPFPGRNKYDDVQCTLYTYPYPRTRLPEQYATPHALWYKSHQRIEWRLMDRANREKPWEYLAKLQRAGSLLFHFINLRFRFADEEQPCRILRNLSKREYVREAAVLALRAKYAESKRMQKLTLGEVLIPRICWSSHGGMSLDYLTILGRAEEDKLNLHKGVWAGDRFDVVVLEGAEVEEGWTDVSDDLLDLVEKIWVGECM